MTDEQQNTETRRPRLHLHDDGLVLSIGFENTNDTLLTLKIGAARYNPEIDHDRGDMLVLRQWVAAIKSLLATGGKEQELCKALESSLQTLEHYVEMDDGESLARIEADRVRSVLARTARLEKQVRTWNEEDS